jgi:hypothetical protein
MTADQTTTKIRRPESQADDDQHTWVPDTDDPPLIAPYCDPFLALLVGFGVGIMSSILIACAMGAAI